MIEMWLNKKLLHNYVTKLYYFLMDNKYKLSAKRANLRISQTATIFLLNNNTGQILRVRFRVA